MQTQVIPYLMGLADDGIEVSLLTFEPDLKTWTKSEIEAERASLHTRGVRWHCLAYHKNPTVPATLYDILNGARYVRKLLKSDVDILHCRVHVPALMGAIARSLSRGKPKILFDIRGFFPEEYTDAGVWPQNGWIYRCVKRVEKWLLKEADGFVVLTEKARDVLFPESAASGVDKLGRPVEVIPCCVDFDTRFSNADRSRQEARAAIGVSDRFVVVHLGALGGLYLTREIADFLEAARLQVPRTFAMLLTQSDPAEIDRLLTERGFSDADYLIRKVEPKDVPRYLEASDVAISFVRSSYSTLSRSPTKIPEYLACGVPIIANRGVGDVDELISGNRIGALLSEFSEEGYKKALAEIDSLRERGDLESRCRAVARSGFDLRNVGWERYKRLYRKLLTAPR